jgi:phosphoheptose isomerase
MNGRQALEMNDWVINKTIERAKRVMNVRGISYDEALDFCEEVELKYETDRSRLAGIQIRYNTIKKQL